MGKSTWIAVAIVIVVAVAVAVAFVAGRGSANTPQQASTPQVASDTIATMLAAPQAASVSTQAPVQATSKAQPAPSVSSAPSEPSMDAGIVTNSAPCEEIANEAAQSEETQGIAQNISVTQAHLKEQSDSKGNSYDECYYELSFSYYTPSSGEVSATVIRAAPDDTPVADCSDSAASGLTCFSGGLSQISEETFQLIEAQLLTN